MRTFIKNELKKALNANKFSGRVNDAMKARALEVITKLVTEPSLLDAFKKYLVNTKNITITMHKILRFQSTSKNTLKKIDAFQKYYTPLCNAGFSLDHVISITSTISGDLILKCICENLTALKALGLTPKMMTDIGKYPSAHHFFEMILNEEKCEEIINTGYTSIQDIATLGSRGGCSEFVKQLLEYQPFLQKYPLKNYTIILSANNKPSKTIKLVDHFGPIDFSKMSQFYGPGSCGRQKMHLLETVIATAKKNMKEHPTDDDLAKIMKEAEDALEHTQQISRSVTDSKSKKGRKKIIRNQKIIEIKQPRARKTPRKRKKPDDPLSEIGDGAAALLALYGDNSGAIPSAAKKHRPPQSLARWIAPDAMFGGDPGARPLLKRVASKQAQDTTAAAETAGLLKRPAKPPTYSWRLFGPNAAKRVRVAGDEEAGNPDTVVPPAKRFRAAGIT